MKIANIKYYVTEREKAERSGIETYIKRESG